LGIKGVGEAGAIAPPACMMQAFEDALGLKDMFITESSINPSKLYHYVQKAKGA
jgi:carbon-monoxide dehydrogenase large subunit